MDLDERFDPRTPRTSRWDGTRRGLGCGKLLLPVIIIGFVSLPFLPWRKVKSGLIEVADHLKSKPVVQEKIVTVEVPQPPPALPDKFVYTKDTNLAELSNGMQLRNEFETLPGAAASTERQNDAAYQISFKVSVNVPQPIQKLDEFAKLNPTLVKSLPGLESMIPAGKVSGFFFHMYEEKKKDIQIDLTRLDKILTKHNFYDLETVMELQHPQTKQKALLLQGEMDVVSDGSDGDRMASFDDYIAKSAHFQPTTSYNWKKLTQTPNPLLPRYQEKLAAAKEKMKSGTKEEQRTAKGQAETTERYIAEMKARSYLIAQEDPFIVIPLSMRSYNGFNEYAPSLGDYAVVIFQDKLYPAIVGDYGPREKAGEASLRIARQINPKASPYARPVSDLHVTYLIFPGTADKPTQQPNLEKWGQRCGELITTIGGLGAGYSLHAWEDRFKAKPQAVAAPGATTPPTQ